MRSFVVKEHVNRDKYYYHIKIVYVRASNICPSPNFSGSAALASSATLVERLGKDVVTQEVVQRLEPATTALELCCRIAIAARR